MDKVDFKEKQWGFIFGVIAILAAVVEMILNGISAASVVGCVKDVFGTAVVVVVFYYLLMSMPKKPKNTTEVLKNAVENWGLDNAPLIFKTEGYVSAQDSPYTQGFVLLQNPKTYPSLVELTPENPNWIDYAQYHSPKRLTGKFLDMPEYETMTSSQFKAMFVMEQKHFQELGGEDTVGNIVKAVDKKYGGTLKVNRIGKSAKFTIQYNQIVTNEDIEFFVDSLDFVLSLVKVIA